MGKDYTPLQYTPLQERVLDALERCFDQYGFQKTTLGDVAREAGVSRMTVYRNFEDRDALFRAAALRNMVRQWQQLTDQLPAIEQLDEWLLEAVMAFLRLFSDHQIVQLYSRIGGHDEGLRVALTEPGLRTVAAHFQHLYDRAQAAGRIAPGLCEDDLVEWIHRTNYTLIVHPTERMQDEEHLRRWLAAQIHGGLVSA